VKAVKTLATIKINGFGYEEDGNPSVLGTEETQFDPGVPDLR